MHGEPPKLVAINHDDYHAEHIGTTADGRQFFLTLPFEFASSDEPGCEYVALYLFDRAGDALRKVHQLDLPAIALCKLAVHA